MLKIISWLIGFSLGAALGALLIAIFVPTTSREIRQRLSAGYEETMDAARLASQQERKALEAELATMQKRALPPVR